MKKEETKIQDAVKIALSKSGCKVFKYSEDFNTIFPQSHLHFHISALCLFLVFVSFKTN